jgi:hypothetical protein
MWTTGVIFDVFLCRVHEEGHAPVALTDQDLSDLLAALKARLDDRHHPHLAGVRSSSG